MSVREIYRQIFKLHMSRKFRRMRFEADLTREQMSAMFMMDPRSYWDLENAQSAPSGLTLSIYLAIADEKEIQNFISELRTLLVEAVEAS